MIDEKNAIEASYTAVPTERTLETVAGEIRALTNTAQRTMLGYVVEIGRRLIEAKSLCKHGEWGKWLEESVNYSQSTANNFMSIFRAYADGQLSLFGDVPNSQAYQNLGYTKLLALIAVPQEEREDFVRDVDAEAISVRELQAKIREREEKIAALEQAETAKDGRIAELEAADTGEAERLRARQTELERKAADAEAALKQRLAEQEALQATLDKAKKAKREALDKLKALKEHPEIPKSELERIEAEAKARAEAAMTAELERRTAAAAQEADSAGQELLTLRKEREEAEARIAALEKRLTAADPEVQTFKLHFQQLQETFNRALAVIDTIRERDTGTADKLTAALRQAATAMLGRVTEEGTGK